MDVADTCRCPSASCNPEGCDRPATAASELWQVWRPGRADTREDAVDAEGTHIAQVGSCSGLSLLWAALPIVAARSRATSAGGRRRAGWCQ